MMCASNVLLSIKYNMCHTYEIHSMYELASMTISCTALQCSGGPAFVLVSLSLTVQLFVAERRHSFALHLQRSETLSNNYKDAYIRTGKNGHSQ
jgi:hypothetical protein